MSIPTNESLKTLSRNSKFTDARKKQILDTFTRSRDLSQSIWLVVWHLENTKKILEVMTKDLDIAYQSIHNGDTRQAHGKLDKMLEFLSTIDLFERIEEIAEAIRVGWIDNFDPKKTLGM